MRWSTAGWPCWTSTGSRGGGAAPRTRSASTPDAPAAHLYLGQALSAQGQSREAEASFREALRLRPGYAEAAAYLGVALSAQGRFAEAEASLRHALRIRPDLGEASYRLGVALASLGRDEEALQEFAAALRSEARPEDDGARAPRHRHGPDPPRQDRRRPRPPWSARSTSTPETTMPPTTSARCVCRPAGIRRRSRSSLRCSRARRTTPMRAASDAVRWCSWGARRRRRVSTRCSRVRARWTPKSATTSASRCGSPGHEDQALAAFREALRLRPGIRGGPRGTRRAMNTGDLPRPSGPLARQSPSATRSAAGSPRSASL